MKLNDVPIRVTGEGKAEFSYRASANVSKVDGTFSIELDQRLVEIAGSIQHSDGCNALGIYDISYHSNKTWVMAKELLAARRFIEKCAKDYLQCEVKTETVILYGYQLCVQFWKDAKGGLHPNGTAGAGGEWFKGSYKELSTHARLPFYSVGFAACVMLKKTYARASGTTVEWELVHESKDEYADKLNSFINLDVDPERHSEYYKEMTYSPEATKFFYTVMTNICKLADQIHTFFGSEPELLKAIQSGNLLTFK